MDPAKDDKWPAVFHAHDRNLVTNVRGYSLPAASLTDINAWPQALVQRVGIGSPTVDSQIFVKFFCASD